MFDGAVIQEVKKGKYRVIIKTKYARIEQTCDDRVQAVQFLNRYKSEFDIIAYEIIPVKD